MNKLSILACSILLSAPTFADTIYTGDIIDGKKVISKLDIADQVPGTHHYYFKGATTAVGQHWYVPVVVIKGKNPGKVGLLQAGIHGDELNGIGIVQKTLETLDPEEMNGAVISVIGANSSGVSNLSRYWSFRRNASVDFNRIHPGREDGDSAQQHAWLLWNNLYPDNLDFALDYHTQGQGSSYRFFIYADYRNPEIVKLAEAFPADDIKKDNGEKGTVETTFVEKGIPAITVEAGMPLIFDKQMINKGVEGTKNVLKNYNIIPGKQDATYSPNVGSKWQNIRTKQGGFVEYFVELGDKVEKGTLVARQFDSFGKELQQYHAEVDGIVVSKGTDATKGSRSTLVRIMY